MRLSVITVTYNCRDLLERTLESVQRQTFPAVEHIIVDGGSQDGTAELIRQREAWLGRWISEPDKGIYDAMNKGLNMASGDYILYLNAGDTFFEPGTVEKIFAPDHDADIYYGQTKITDRSGNITGDRRLRAPEKLNWKSFRHGMLVCHQSFIVKRSIAPAYDLSYAICSDIDWCIRCMKAAGEIQNTHQYISCFLEGGVSRQQEKKAWRERFAIMKKYYGISTTLLSHLYILYRFLRWHTRFP